MRALKSLFFLASSEDDSWINPVFWTLKIEMQFYLLIALLILLRKKNRELFLISVSTVIVLICVFTSTKLESQIELIGSLPFFLIGMLAACQSKMYHRAYISVAMFVMLLRGTENVILVSDMNKRSGLAIFIILLFAATCTALAFWSSAVSSYKNQLFNSWGMTTYAVYLFHIDPFRPFLEKLIEFGVGPVPSYFISAGTLITFSHGMTHVVELYIGNKMKDLKFKK
jgi:peptidoglycan/LPS O-acetylase OafA/YrhL